MTQKQGEKQCIGHKKRSGQNNNFAWGKRTILEQLGPRLNEALPVLCTVRKAELNRSLLISQQHDGFDKTCTRDSLLSSNSKGGQLGLVQQTAENHYEASGKASSEHAWSYSEPYVQAFVFSLF